MNLISTQVSLQATSVHNIIACEFEKLYSSNGDQGHTVSQCSLKHYFAHKLRNFKICLVQKNIKKDKKKKEKNTIESLGLCPLDSQTNTLPIAPLGNNCYMSHCF